MEPLDSDYEVVAREPNPQARFNWLYLFPALGVLWMALLASAAIFQFPLTSVIDPVMGFMLVLFFVLAGLLFWTHAPGAKK
jgi:fatty acid desaturase